MVPEEQQKIENCIKASISGDTESFRCVFNYAKERIFQYILSRSNNRDDALDLTQEVFIDIWKALPRFNYRSFGQFHGFIFLVARRRLIKYYRSRKPEVSFQDQTNQLPAEDITTESNLDNNNDLLADINKLPKKYQEILRLRYWSNLSYQEISYTLKITAATAKVWHHRAINKLKKILK